MIIIRFINFELFKKIKKLLKLARYPSLVHFLFKGIVPTFEHEKVLLSIGKLGSLVDCGCNKGQFALISFKKNYFFQYLAFDPIRYPLPVINYLENKNVEVFFRDIALSNNKGLENFFITKRDDSSSLKKPKKISFNYFANVYTVKTKKVRVDKLNSFFDLIYDLKEPRLLKIDVQGNEFELLKGSESILKMFKFIIIECTYFDLYENIKFKVEDIDKLILKNNFLLFKEYNKLFKRKKLISSDRLYINKSNQ